MMPSFMDHDKMLMGKRVRAANHSAGLHVKVKSLISVLLAANQYSIYLSIRLTAFLLFVFLSFLFISFLSVRLFF